MLNRGVELVHFAMGDRVIEQGDEGDSMFVVLAGSVAVYFRDRKGGQNRKVSELGVGQYFGEMSLFTGQPRMATVIALQEGAECLEVSAGAVGPVVAARPTLMDEIAATVAARQVDTSGAAKGLGDKEREQEVAAVAQRVQLQIQSHLAGDLD
mmetsp:Transcript_5257/g.18357  ORF Transcript_5257/g.18357 Transcript_5257/m.18357 type:complete len:153 (+) Transcript_5257:899-1357(+)